MENKTRGSLEIDQGQETCSGTYALLNLQPQPAVYGLIQETPIVLTVRNTCCRLPIVQLSNSPIKIGGSAYELLAADTDTNGKYSFQIRLQLISSYGNDASYQIQQNVTNKAKKTNYWLSNGSDKRAGQVDLKYEGGFAIITGQIEDGYEFFASQSGCIRLSIDLLEIGILLTNTNCGCSKQKTKDKADNCVAINAELYFSVLTVDEDDAGDDENAVCTCNDASCGCNTGDEANVRCSPLKPHKKTEILVVAVCNN
jgi:hypothetical protein